MRDLRESQPRESNPNVHEAQQDDNVQHQSSQRSATEPHSDESSHISIEHSLQSSQLEKQTSSMATVGSIYSFDVPSSVDPMVVSAVSSSSEPVSFTDPSTACSHSLTENASDPAVTENASDPAAPSQEIDPSETAIELSQEQEQEQEGSKVRSQVPNIHLDWSFADITVFFPLSPCFNSLHLWCTVFTVVVCVVTAVICTVFTVVVALSSLWCLHCLHGCDLRCLHCCVCTVFTIVACTVFTAVICAVFATVVVPLRDVHVRRAVPSWLYSCFLSLHHFHHLHVANLEVPSPLVFLWKFTHLLSGQEGSSSRLLSKRRKLKRPSI